MKDISKETGKQYWRSLNELADTPEFRDLVEREFPEGASELNDPVSRRTFLSLMGASIALAGLAGCRRPVEKIIPYVVGQENIVPGVPKFYATTLPFGLENTGVLAENHEGRPTKLEGNTAHPASLGATNSFIQAAILNLYDPDRSKSVYRNSSRSDWDSFVATWRQLYLEHKKNGGADLAVLSETFASPTLARLKKEFTDAFPNATWVSWEPVTDENIFTGINAVTGKQLQPEYNFDKAQVVLSIDSDFLNLETNSISNTKGFSAARRVESEKDSMNRLYVVESGFTVTGGMADHRLTMAQSQVPAFTLALAGELNEQGLKLPSGIKLPTGSTSFDKKWLSALARDLIKNSGQCLVTAGRRQPAEVQALVLLLNQALENAGKTIQYLPFSDSGLPSTAGLTSLVEKINDGKISTLVMLGGNPVYNAPADLNFKLALAKVETTVHLSSHVDETSELVTWHIPETHFLEAWGDGTASDGTQSITQPQIAPLFNAVSRIELLGAIASGEKNSGYDLVRKTWEKILPVPGFEKAWRAVLHNGVFKERNVKATPAVNRNRFNKFVRQFNWEAPAPTAAKPELILAASNSTFDGRFANNGWLQESPDPITKLVWDNAAIMSRKTAEEMGFTNNELVEVTTAAGTVALPVWIVPGQADYTITASLGYGRKKSGRIGTGVGQDTYRLRDGSNLWKNNSIKLARTGDTFELSCTQDHSGLDLEALASDAIDKRLPVILREATLDEYREHPNFAEERVQHPPLVSMWEEKDYSEGYQWGMTIDLNTCTGCNSCSIACQSENNIPVIGKKEVGRGREMSWLRMDRYFSGSEEDPEMVYQPVACQHCENAPCEQVCPVAATVHDDEGLNVMTYNRCVGTRYCANNCPYKVRRFNFFNYTKETPDIVEMAMNPDVTVRTRGVMEKCSFCVQRISMARITAKNEDREIRDGEVQSACQQTCPADAIVFGNINDPNSRVSQVKQQNRNYALLGELNTKPRTTYLAKLRNPNPELVS